MGNKQTVFTHEQLEAYQVGMMDQAIGGFGSLVVFLAEEMGTASLHPGGVGGAVSKRSWGGSVCGFRQQWAVGEEGGAPPTPARHQAGSGLSQHLSPQDCTFFTRKEIMRSV